MSAAVTAPLGISSFTAGLISKVRTSLKLEVKVIPQFDSSFGAAASINPTGEFSVEGFGDSSAALGAAGSQAPSLVTGGVILVDMTGENEKSDGFNGWKYHGGWWPNASS